MHHFVCFTVVIMSFVNFSFLNIGEVVCYFSKILKFFKEKSVEVQGQVTLVKEDTTEANTKTEIESLKMEAAGVSETPTPSFSDISKSTAVQEDEQQVQLRRQIVSLGKQPKAQQIRRKKDMVRELNPTILSFDLEPIK